MVSSLNLSEEESIGFDFFRSKTAVEIQGCFQTTLWQSLVLQITQHEHSVLHAAIAVGCAHRKFAGRNGSSLATDVYDQRQFFGLKQYLKAISSLRSRIHDLEDLDSSRIALVTCLLFICHEMFRGERVGAVSHLTTGLRILASRTTSRSLADPSTLTLRHDSEDIHDQLVSIFARLDYDSTMFGQRSPHFSLSPTQETTNEALHPRLRRHNTNLHSTNPLPRHATLTFTLHQLDTTTLLVHHAGAHETHQDHRNSILRRPSYLRISHNPRPAPHATARVDVQPQLHLHGRPWHCVAMGARGDAEW